MSRKALLNCLPAAALLGIWMNSHSTESTFGAAPQQDEPAAPVMQSSGATAGRPAVIRVNSHLVVVPVSVTDSTGRPVDNLQASDFRIEEDDKPEPIARMADPGQAPLDLALLFDISGSVNPRFGFEQEAARHFLERVFRQNDLISIIAITEEPQVVQRVTCDLRAALDSLQGLQPTRGMTAFFDSVVEAARLLRRTASPPDARRVEVVLSDGEDNNSMNYRLDDALREIQRADCIFYAINPCVPSINLNKISLRGQEAMQSLALETGGWVFMPNGLPDLEAIFTRIATELRFQYLLEYYSSNTRSDGAFRRIAVTIPGRPDLRIRARQGYYAPMS